MLDVGKSALPLTVHVLGEVDFPAQPIVQGQLRGNAPGVLPIEESALLTFRRVQAAADVTIHERHIAQQKGRQIQATGSAVGCPLGTKVKLTGAVSVARHPEVFGKADIATKFYLVVTNYFRPVIYELELLLALG